MDKRTAAVVARMRAEGASNEQIAAAATRAADQAAAQAAAHAAARQQADGVLARARQYLRRHGRTGVKGPEVTDGPRTTWVQREDGTIGREIVGGRPWTGLPWERPTEEQLRAEAIAAAEAGPLVPAPNNAGCMGCGVNESTRWRPLLEYRGIPGFLCGPCAADLDAEHNVLGSGWKDRLLCRAAGLMPGSGYHDFAHTVGFRSYAEVDRGGPGSTSAFGYLPDVDLTGLRTLARTTWPGQLADEVERQVFTKAKTRHDSEKAAAKAAEKAAAGTLRLDATRPRHWWEER